MKIELITILSQNRIFINVQCDTKAQTKKLIKAFDAFGIKEKVETKID